MAYSFRGEDLAEGVFDQNAPLSAQDDVEMGDAEEAKLPYGALEKTQHPVSKDTTGRDEAMMVDHEGAMGSHEQDFSIDEAQHSVDKVTTGLDEAKTGHDEGIMGYNEAMMVKHEDGMGPIEGTPLQDNTVEKAKHSTSNPTSSSIVGSHNTMIIDDDHGMASNAQGMGYIEHRKASNEPASSDKLIDLDSVDSVAIADDADDADVANGAAIAGRIYQRLQLQAALEVGPPIVKPLELSDEDSAAINSHYVAINSNRLRLARGEIELAEFKHIEKVYMMWIKKLCAKPALESGEMTKEEFDQITIENMKGINKDWVMPEGGLPEDDRDNWDDLPDGARTPNYWINRALGVDAKSTSEHGDDGADVGSRRESTSSGGVSDEMDISNPSENDDAPGGGTVPADASSSNAQNVAAGGGILAAFDFSFAVPAPAGPPSTANTGVLGLFNFALGTPAGPGPAPRTNVTGATSQNTGTSAMAMGPPPLPAGLPPRPAHLPPRPAHLNSSNAGAEAGFGFGGSDGPSSSFIGIGGPSHTTHIEGGHGSLSGREYYGGRGPNGSRYRGSRASRGERGGRGSSSSSFPFGFAGGWGGWGGPSQH